MFIGCSHLGFYKWQLYEILYYFLQYGSFQRQILVEELNKKWKRILSDTSVMSFWIFYFYLFFLKPLMVFIVCTVTSNYLILTTWTMKLIDFNIILLSPTYSPVRHWKHCEWLNKLLTEIWPNHINPKLLSLKFSTIVEVKLSVLLHSVQSLFSNIVFEVDLGVTELIMINIQTTKFSLNCFSYYLSLLFRNIFTQT